MDKKAIQAMIAKISALRDELSEMQANQQDENLTAASNYLQDAGYALEDAIV